MTEFWPMKCRRKSHTPIPVWLHKNPPLVIFSYPPTGGSQWPHTDVENGTTKWKTPGSWVTIWQRAAYPHWTAKKEKEFLLDYVTDLGASCVTAISGYCANTLSAMADESSSRRAPAISLPEVTRNFQSHIGDSSSQRPCLVQLWIPRASHRDWPRVNLFIQ